MVRYLTFAEVLELHRLIREATGGAGGLRDSGALEAAVMLPRQTFAGVELYPSILSKAAVLGFGLIQNHAFVDGNKRVGHAAMETFLMLNGLELSASVDESEQAILQVASGKLTKDQLLEWLSAHTIPGS